MAVTYLSREDWGGGPHRSGYAQDPTAKIGLAIHHTVIVMADYDGDGYLRGDLDDIKRYMRSLQVARPDLGGEVPYNFVVFAGATDDDAVVAEGRGRAWSGAHTVDYNTSRLGCAYAGNADVDRITTGIIDGFNWIGATQLVGPTNAETTFGHRDVKATACPGGNLYPRLGEIQPPFEYDQGGLVMDKEVSDAFHDTRKMILQGTLQNLEAEWATRRMLRDAGVLPAKGEDDSELEASIAEIKTKLKV